MEEIGRLVDLKREVLKKSIWHKKADTGKIINQLRKEIKEFEQALASGNMHHAQEELGDCYWDLISLTVAFEKEHGIDLKSILKNTHNKLSKRFSYVFGKNPQTIEEELFWWEKYKEEVEND